MKRGTPVIDTGPLVAILDRRDQHHQWAVEQFGKLKTPLLTCEAVLTEACFLVRRMPGGSAAVLEMVGRGTLKVAFQLEAEVGPISKLMARYANIPMSLADACLVRMCELHANSEVITVDSDFHIYRRNGRQAIPVLMPPRR